MTELTPQEWASTVESVLAAHPDWLEATIVAVQSGVTEAIEHQRDRVQDLSFGLMEALNTRPGAVRRDRQRIVRAIEVSQLHPTKWSADMIARETKPRDGDPPA